MIYFLPLNGISIAVYRSGNRIGQILTAYRHYCFFPKQGFGGQVFSTLEDCQQSIA